MISKFYEISSDGSLYDPSCHDFVPGEKLTIIPIVGVQWEYKDKEVRKIYTYLNAPDLLPNRDGVVAIEKSKDSIDIKDELVVYEPDGQERFRINPPLVSTRSKPSKAHFHYLGYSDKSNEWVCTFNDGDKDYSSVLNPLTGDMTRIAYTRI